MQLPSPNRKTLVASVAGLALTVGAGASAIAVNAGIVGGGDDPAPFEAVPAAGAQDLTIDPSTTLSPATSIVVVDDFVYENGTPAAPSGGVNDATAATSAPTTRAAPAVTAPATPTAGHSGDDDHRGIEGEDHDGEAHEDERDD